MRTPLHQPKKPKAWRSSLGGFGGSNFAFTAIPAILLCAAVLFGAGHFHRILTELLFEDDLVTIRQVDSTPYEEEEKEPEPPPSPEAVMAEFRRSAQGGTPPGTGPIILEPVLESSRTTPPIELVPPPLPPFELAPVSGEVLPQDP
ncbi:MAG: hypothetical protein EA425_10615 [Puniceicoccaceae bacterium]|nr:MAG: hypothetical protein EA425_10615 [Puniceicoccaceae bacterium]